MTADDLLARPSLIRTCFDCDGFGLNAIKDPLVDWKEVFRKVDPTGFALAVAEWDYYTKLGHEPDTDNNIYVVCTKCKGTKLVSWSKSLFRLTTLPFASVLHLHIFFDNSVPPSTNPLQMFWFLAYKKHLDGLWRDVSEEFVCWRLAARTRKQK